MIPNLQQHQRTLLLPFECADAGVRAPSLYRTFTGHEQRTHTALSSTEYEVVDTKDVDLDVLQLKFYISFSLGDLQSYRPHRHQQWRCVLVCARIQYWLVKAGIGAVPRAV